MSEEEVSVQFGAETKGFDAGTKAAASSLGNVSDAVGKTERVFSDLNRGIMSHQKRLEDLNKEYQVIGRSANTAKGSFDSLASSFSGMNRQKVLTLQYTASDIVASLASGISPLTILMQQGGQVAQVFGAASLKIMGVGLAIGGAAYAVYDWWSAAQDAERATNQLNIALEATGKAVLSSDLQDEAKALARLPNVSKEAADQLIMGYSRAYNIGGDMIQGLTRLTIDFAAATGQEMGQAQKVLTRAFAEPAEGAKQLQHVFNDQLDPAIVNDIINMAKLGDVSGAQAKMFDLLNDKVKNAAENGLTDFDKQLNKVYNTLKDMGKEIKESWSGTSFMGFLSGGMVGTIGPQPDKKREKSAGEIQDEKEVLALIAAQEEANKKMERALELSRSVTSQEQERETIVRRIKDIQAQADVAKGRGNSSEYQTLLEGVEAYQEKLNKIDEAKARQAERAQKEAEREARQAAMSSDSQIQSLQRVEDEKYRTAEEMIRLQVSLKEIGLEEEYAALKENRERQYQADVIAMDRRRELWAKGSDEWRRITDEMAIAYEKYNQELMKLDERRIREVEQRNAKIQKEEEKAAKEAAKPWDKAFGVVEHSLDSMLEGILRGTQTTDEAIRRLAGNLVLSMINATTKGVLEWIKGEAMKTSATLTGNATRTSSDLAASAASSVGEKAAASGDIMMKASESAANVYESVSAIPYVGWIMAPAAAAAAFGAVAAFNSFEVGTNYVPTDMKAQIHEGERIVPKADNQRLMEAVEGGGSGGAQIHFHIKAMDGKDVKKFLAKNSKAIGKQMQGYLRSGGRIAMAGG